MDLSHFRVFFWSLERQWDHDSQCHLLFLTVVDVYACVG